MPEIPNRFPMDSTLEAMQINRGQQDHQVPSSKPEDEDLTAGIPDDILTELPPNEEAKESL